MLFFEKKSIIREKKTATLIAYASTIHKSQGQTLDKEVIDLGKSEKSLGLTFVALSRV